MTTTVTMHIGDVRHQRHAGLRTSYRGQHRTTLRTGRFEWACDVRLPREKKGVSGQTSIFDILDQEPAA